MCAQFLKSENNKLVRTKDIEQATNVIIPIEEYNGLKNALRIVKDRSIQQIEKSKADENGYRLLRADLKFYNVREKEKAWLITKSTPYSSKIPLNEIMSILKNDLKNSYNFVEDIRLEDEISDKHTRLKLVPPDDIIKAMNYMKKYPERDFVLNNNLYGKELKKFMEQYEALAFEISKVSVNYSEGVYEVSYWATNTI